MKIKYSYIPLLFIAGIFYLIGTNVSATSPNSILDLPIFINNAIFGGGYSTLGLVKMGMAAIAIIATMLPLLYLGANMMQIFLAEFLIIGVLTGLGWLDASVVIILVLIIGLTYSKTITDVILGGRSA